MGFRILILGAGLITLTLLAGAVFTFWRTGWVEEQYPPSGQFLEVPGARLHFQISGTASKELPTLFLLHGASTNLNDFNALLKNLPPELHVVRVDRPGAGYSVQHGGGWMDPAQQTQAVIALQQSLNISRAVWVGHSLAGSLVMTGLADYPQQVAGGVMLAGAAYSWEGGVDFIDHLPAFPVLGPVLTHSVISPAGALKFEQGIESAFAPNPVTEDYRSSSAIDLYLRPSQFAATARDVSNLSDYFTQRTGEYSRITQPLLLIHGDEDTIVPAWNHADRLIKALPSATYHTLAQTGHQPHHVHAQAVSDWIMGFLSSRRWD